MKKVLLAVIAFGIFTGSAKAEPRSTPWSWNGLYIGVDVGAGAAKSNVSTVQIPAGLGGADLQSFDLSGGWGPLGGFHAGYNWQFAPTWLIGVEGDFAFTSINDTLQAPLTIGGVPVVVGGFAATDTLRRDVKWLASVRARLGYTAANWLLYATGGAAWGEIQYAADQFIVVLGQTVRFADKTTESGWVAGAGAEYAFNKNWIMRGEYLYYSLSGSSGVGQSANFGFRFADTFGRNEIHTGRLGVSHKFSPL